MLGRWLLTGLLCLVPWVVGAVAPVFPGATTQTWTSTDRDVPVVDNAPVISIVDVAGAPGTILDVDVAVQLAHTSSGQLRISLISPAGTTVTLSSNNGGSNDDVFADTLFDDQADGQPSAPNVRNFTYVNLQATGPIQPEQPLASLVGEAAEGPWVLVVLDDTSGSSGILHGWSLSVTTATGVATSEPAVFSGGGGAIPDNNPAGRTSTVEVSGAGPRLYKATAQVNVTHFSSGQLGLFLTSPSGRRVDLVTNLGGGNDDLYAGTTFDDQAGTPIGDRVLPVNGVAFDATPGEGALGAFIGEDPNGTWTLTAVDAGAGTVGTLVDWSLAITTAVSCGDGNTDAGEACDDGNAVDGDGCDSNCIVTACGNGVVTAGEDCDDGNTADGDACPATCRTSVETDCGNCVDDDGNGLVDAFDPACGATHLAPTRQRIVAGPRQGRDRLQLIAPLELKAASGTLRLQLTDADGTEICGEVGTIASRGRRATAQGTLAGGPIAASLLPRGGLQLQLRGRKLDLSALDPATTAVAVRVGDAAFATTAP